jgi:hypothetical protein
VLIGKILAEFLGVDFHRAQAAENPKAQESPNGPAGERFG